MRAFSRASSATIRSCRLPDRGQPDRWRVLLLTDITDLKRGTDEVKRARDYAVAIVETVREPLVVLDEKLAVRSANRSFYEFFRNSPQQIEGAVCTR